MAPNLTPASIPDRSNPGKNKRPDKHLDTQSYPDCVSQRFWERRFPFFSANLHRLKHAMFRALRAISSDSLARSANTQCEWSATNPLFGEF
jgi:hypothetical protein